MSTDPEVQQFLDKMADYIENHGWCQANFENGAGAVCLYGARDKVVPSESEGFWYYYVSREIRRRILNYGGAGVDDWPGSRTVMTWNDTPGRTQDQVVRMLRGKDLAE